jgi:type VI secretion system protein ImpM
VSDTPGLVPGWYGKLPALGDFATRRLPNDFVNQWDTWLQQSIAASRSHLGEDWLDIYMTSPIWRFALFPGVCGARAWAGVIMPSVDKVGRYFPLTLTVALEARAETSMAIFTADAWYAALEDVALSVLRVDGSLDDLEGSLLRHPFPLSTTNSDPGESELNKLMLWWRSPQADALTLSMQHAGAVEKFMGMTMNGMFSTSGYGKSVWWSWRQDTNDGVLHCCGGLPPPDHYATMLLGSLESS